jgi:hypothetical protein
MLTIRKRNLVMLSESIRKGRTNRLVKYVLERFPHVFQVFEKDEEVARGIVERGNAAAAEYGITEEDDVALFVDLMVMYGDDFHREPWASEVLTSDTLTSRQKVWELRNRVGESGALM